MPFTTFLFLLPMADTELGVCSLFFFFFLILKALSSKFKLHRSSADFILSDGYVLRTSCVRLKNSSITYTKIMRKAFYIQFFYLRAYIKDHVKRRLTEFAVQLITLLSPYFV